jgi:nucleoside-diphosphate-sugar epimerase
MIRITGSSGFIGSHLMTGLLSRGFQCESVPKGQLPIYSDGDILIHLAAKTTLSKDFNADLFDSNIIYANRVMKFPGRIIYASSTSAAELTNPYAYTKRYLEHLGEKHGNALGLRFFNVYGNGNNKGIIKRAIECATSAESLFLSGGDQIRDFIYIDDVVNWICDNLDHEPGIIDIGRGEGMSIVGACSTVAHVMNKFIHTRTFPASDVDMKVSIASPGIAGITLEEGLKKMLCES